MRTANHPGFPRVNYYKKNHHFIKYEPRWGVDPKPGDQILLFSTVYTVLYIEESVINEGDLNCFVK